VKIHLNKAGQAGGIILLTVLGLILVLGIYLGGYLYWVRTENMLVASSQAWNSALACAEGGIEEGLAAVNSTFGTNYVPSLSTNWPGGAGGIYGPVTNTFTGGWYSVIVDTTGVCPTITATGYTTVPLLGRTIARTIQVTTTNQPGFANAMTVQQDVTCKGNDILIDSYDSSDPLHSTNGLYYFPTRKAGGDIASLQGFVNVNNADVNGKVSTSPSGSLTVGANGYVGDLTWTSGIEPGWWNTDLNFEIKPIQLPDMTGWATPAAVGTNALYLGTGGWTINGDLTLKNSDVMFVAGYASLYVSGNVSMSSQSTIVIAPGAQLKIYVAGATASFSTVNTTGNAFSFQYYGMPGNTSMTWSGNNTYLGTIYAPQTTMTLGGGGSTLYDYQGACVVNAVAMNGHFNFHYDENLKRVGPTIGFFVTSWQEL
jgi:hypothetical protein